MQLSAMQPQVVETDRIQKTVARIIATSPAGVNLLLIGGFRYRLLDNSHRFSVDIDYHWEGDLDAKQNELLSLCRRLVLGQVRRELGYDGSVCIRKGPDADSPHARFVDLRFWKAGSSIEIPLEVTRIICMDPPIVRTAAGTVHLTPSDADVIESKVLAVLNRLFLQHRDFVDIFLHGEQLRLDSRLRLEQKLSRMNLHPEAVHQKLKDLQEHRQYHSRAVQKVIDEQMDPEIAQQLKAGGGGAAVFESALNLILKVIPT